MKLWKQAGIGLLLLAMNATGRADNIAPTSVKHVNLITRELLYEPVSKKIYASVPGNAGPGGNSVVAIDPLTAEVSAPIPVGSEPGHMAASDDGKYLYVALDTGDIRRVDLTTRKPAGLFHTGGIRQLEVLPGQHDILIVSRGGGAGMGDGVAILDNGAMRPKTGSPNSFARTFGNRVHTYQNEISSWDFSTYAVDATGLNGRANTASLLFGNCHLLGDGNGRVFTDNGQVVDPETQRILGRFPNTTWGTRPLPDAGTNRVFFLNGSHITSDDYTTYVTLDSMDVPEVKGGTNNLIRWGTDGLAFRSDQQVTLVRSRIVAPPVAPIDLALTVTHSPQAVTVGRSITCTVAVVNNGHGQATGVSLSYRLPEGLELVSAQSTQGQVSQTNRLVSVDVGDMAARSRVTLTVVVTPVGEKKFMTTAVVRGNQPDDHPNNNLSDHEINNMLDGATAKVE